jgi:hypothetical protein
VIKVGAPNQIPDITFGECDFHFSLRSSKLGSADNENPHSFAAGI